MDNKIKVFADLYAGAAGMLPKSVVMPVTSRNYPVYLEENSPSVKELESQRRISSAGSKRLPLISVIIIGNGACMTDINTAFISLAASTYSKWELILTLPLSAPDQESYAKYPNVRLIVSDGDERELLKSAQELIRGDAVMLLKPGDRLSPEALFLMAEKYSSVPGCGLVYADNDYKDGNGNRRLPRFKPAFSPVTEISIDYIGRPLIVNASVSRKAGGMTGTSPSDHHRYVLGCMKHTKAAANVRKVLLTANEERGSTGDGCYKLSGDLEVCPGAFDGSFAVVSRRDRKPSASVVIAGAKSLSALRLCLETIDSEAVGDMKLIVSAGRNEGKELSSYLDALKRNKAAVIVTSDGGSIPALLNAGAARSFSEYLIFLSPNAVILTPDFVERLTDPLKIKDTAISGGKLLGPDGMLLHTGTVVGLNGYAGSLYEGTLDDIRDSLKGFYTAVIRNVTAVSGSFMAVSAEDFASAGMFDETFPDVGWDTEFCIRAAQKGLNTVYTPFAAAKLTELPPSYDSASKTNLERCLDATRDHLLFGDPFYSINYDYRETEPRLAIRPAPPIEYGMIRH